MTTLKSFSKIILWFFIVIIVLLALLRAAVPSIVKSGITDWFEQQQLAASVAEVNLELGDGSFSIQGLKAMRDGAEVLNLDEIAVEWSWSALMNSRARIKSFSVDGLKFDINQLDDGNSIVAGIDLARLASKPADVETAQNAPPSESINWQVILDELTLSNIDICYQQASVHDYCNRFKKLTWQGDLNFNLADLDNAALPLVAHGRVELSQLTLHNNQLKRDLLSFDRLDLSDIAIDTPNSISISAISLAPLSLLARNSDDLAPQITRFGDITLTALTLDNLAQLRIGEVNIKDHEALLISDANKVLELNEWLPKANEAKASESGTTDEPSSPEEPAVEKAAFHYSIGQINYVSEKSIQYIDNSLAKPFSVDLNHIEISLDNLDSQHPEQDSQVKYQAQYAKHGKISIEGTAKPLQKKPSFDLAGTIKGLDLRDISAFTREAIGHVIKSGQLDADLTLKADNSVLDSAVDLTLYHFELSALSAKDKEKIDSDFGFPLNSSLSLLKDSDNTIQLSIPITGDIENPDFDPNNVIAQATSGAITSAIISYYTPFGLVSIAGGLIDLATALDLEPVQFASGESTLDTKARNSLGQLTQLMTERPGIHLTVCSFSNTADRVKLLPETADVKIDELKLDVPQIEALANLGESRAASVKQYLTEQKVDPSRLILCRAEHKEGDDIAGVEISI